MRFILVVHAVEIGQLEFDLVAARGTVDGSWSMAPASVVVHDEPTRVLDVDAGHLVGLVCEGVLPDRADVETHRV